MSDVSAHLAGVTLEVRFRFDGGTKNGKAGFDKEDEAPSSKSGAEKRMIKRHPKYKCLASTCIALLTWSLSYGVAFGQQWNGSAVADDPIYRIGNVGIGTTTPGAKLEVQSNGELLRVIPNSPANHVTISTPASHLRLHSGGRSEMDIFGVKDYFKITRRGSVNLFYVGGNGNVGIGTTSPGTKLEVAGTARVSTLEITSDQKYKMNIVPIEGALEAVSNLRGVTFEWRTDEFAERNFEEGEHIGLIAQEVERVLPEAVSSFGDDGAKAVEYANLVAVLIEAVKELKAEGDRMRRRIKALESASLGERR